MKVFHSSLHFPHSTLTWMNVRSVNRTVSQYLRPSFVFGGLSFCFLKNECSVVPRIQEEV